MRDIYLESELKMAPVTNLKCTKCVGRGCIDPKDISVCKKWVVQGCLLKFSNLVRMISQTTQMCNDCRGKGKSIHPSKYCYECGGTRS